MEYEINVAKVVCNNHKDITYIHYFTVKVSYENVKKVYYDLLKLYPGLYDITIYHKQTVLKEIDYKSIDF